MVYKYDTPYYSSILHNSPCHRACAAVIHFTLCEDVLIASALQMQPSAALYRDSARVHMPRSMAVRLRVLVVVAEYLSTDCVSDGGIIDLYL